jgi:Rrf2 family iron-sulfur cluster assembly transcriptional regulator
MKISTKGRYALRLMLDLSNNEQDKFISLKEIAQRQDISIKYLEQIITLLCKVGYLKSLRGSQGGYKLAKSPSEYTVGDILRITEGDLAPVSCLQDEENQCSRSTECLTLPFWKGLYNTVNTYVDNYTLEDLNRQVKNKEC